MKVATVLSILVLAGLASAAEDNTDNFENNVRAKLEDHSQQARDVAFLTCLLDEGFRCSLADRTFIEKLLSTMKTIVCLFALVAVCMARPEQYTDKYDNIDLDEILSNQRLLIPYLKCILEEGKCSPEGKELKSHIKEALENNCGKCTDAQKNGTRKVIGHLINKEKEYWDKLCAKYDPQRKYVSVYEKELREVAA